MENFFLPRKKSLLYFLKTIRNFYIEDNSDDFLKVLTLCKFRKSQQIQSLKATFFNFPINPSFIVFFL